MPVFVVGLVAGASATWLLSREAADLSRWVVTGAAVYAAGKVLKVW